MAWPHARTANSVLRAPLWGATTLALVGCAGLNPFVAGRIDPNSPIAAEVAAASRSPGRYPKLTNLPPVPTDVRSAEQWRVAVVSEQALGRRTEQEAAAIPFTLSDSEAWAASMRARIDPALAVPPPADASQSTEDYAAAKRARATPPPSPR